MGKSNELNQLEESLREFIVEEYEHNTAEKENFNPYKYRGLTMVVNNLAKGATPNFKVQIAMLEAEFSIDTGKKLGGGLGGQDERMIETWLDRSNNRQLLRAIWDGKTEDKFVKIQPFDL